MTVDPRPGSEPSRDIPQAVEQWFQSSTFGTDTEAGRARARRALSALDAGAFSGLEEATREWIRRRLTACLHTP